MVVGRSEFEQVLEKLRAVPALAFDTETTGLRPYHGHAPFSLILGTDAEQFYFNFWAYPGMDPEEILTPGHWAELSDRLFSDPAKVWYAHNALFDLAMLAQIGVEIAGTVHCTQSIARVEYNDHMEYNLDACAERIGFQKDDAVEAYIAEHSLWEWEQVPGKKQRDKNKFYYRVPFEVMRPYGERDAEICYRLARHQEEALQRLTNDTPETLPSVRNILENERRLTRTVHRMERVGLRIDRPYCVRAARYEADRAEKAVAAFKAATGKDFAASPKLFADVFHDERELWGYTDKGNPSFESEYLQRFKNPAARAVLDYRDAKSKSDFYQNFLHHADRDDVVHPGWQQWGTASGRFSSSKPNFQNLTSEEDADEVAQEFVVRRAIIPRDGYLLIMPDFDQMEYRMMFDYACNLVGRETPVVRRIKEGYDPHQATADIVTAGGTPLSRKRAKNGNFAFLYGSGIATMAKTIGSSEDEARALKQAISQAAPEVALFIRSVSDTVRKRGFIFNWLGRRAYFPDPNFAYKAPNYLIQGGCADVVKVAMNRIDEALAPTRSRMIATIHDELPIEVHESEVEKIPRLVKEIMESVYPHQYLPLTVGMEYSTKSLADKVKGFPT